MTLLAIFLSLAHCKTSGGSLFQIEGRWRTHEGKTISLRSLEGRPTLLAMVYLRCQYLCPTIISEVRWIELQLSDAQKKKLQIVLVSFDPEHDTSKAMQETVTKRQLPSSWKIITSDQEGVLRTLTNALEFHFRKESDSEFTHSFLISALDSEGVIQARVTQANQDKRELVATLKALLP